MRNSTKTRIAAVLAGLLIGPTLAVATARAKDLAEPPADTCNQNNIGIGCAVAIQLGGGTTCNQCATALCNANCHNDTEAAGFCAIDAADTCRAALAPVKVVAPKPSPIAGD